MSTALGVPCQAIPSYPSPVANPAALAGRLLAQFEEDLRNGENKRAHLVNKALLELQEQLCPEKARLVERGIEDAWRRATGFSF